MRAPLAGLCWALCLVLAFAGRAPARPAHCEIELVNDSHAVAAVFVRFDNGETTHFTMHPRDTAHYVSLFFGGHCHSGAHVRIELHLAAHRELVYDAFTHANATIRIAPH